MHIFHKYSEWVVMNNPPAWLVKGCYYPTVYQRKCKKCGEIEFKVVE